MADHVESTQTIERLNALTRTGLEFDTWTGARLQQALEETKLILLLDFPQSKNAAGSTLLARREVWFANKQPASPHPHKGMPSLFDSPTTLEPSAFTDLPAGAEWYSVDRYWIGHQRRFMSCGYGQLPNDTLSAWLGSRIADITASFDEALAFLGA